jgi:hypothetical protein
MRPRRVTSVAVLVGVAFTMFATPAQAGTTSIGSVQEIASGAAPSPMTVNGFKVQTATVAGHVYTVPAGFGVITRFLHRTGTASGTLAFKVYRPTGVPGQFQVVASESREVIAGTTHAFDVRIPVSPGDTLGLSSSTGVQMAYSTAPGDELGSFGGPDPATGQVVDVTGSSDIAHVLDVAAVLETDADGDGYGDESQDGCATDARTSGKCAQTTIKKAPKKTVLTDGTRAKVKIAFTGADPAGTFRCSVDGRAFKACRSPYKKWYKLGRHKVVVKAVNAQGVADLTPAVVRFKVKQRP